MVAVTQDVLISKCASFAQRLSIGRLAVYSLLEHIHLILLQSARFILFGGDIPIVP